MEGGDGNVDVDKPNCQPSTRKKLKKDDNPEDDRSNQSFEEIEDKDKNPFEIQVILDVVFKMLSFEDVKKFRLVSSTWNEVGALELSRRPQKPIKFHDIEDFRLEGKLDELIQQQKCHDLLFPHQYHQLFSKFSINISIWSHHHVASPLFDVFFNFFKPTFVCIYGDLSYSVKSSSAEDTNEDSLPFMLSTFLAKISSTVQEIDFNEFHIQVKNKDSIVELAVAEELIRTRFPRLRKISNNIANIILQKMFFYPIIGQNLPQFRHLKFGVITEECLGSPEYMKEKFEKAGLMSKLKILDINDLDRDLLKVITEFGQNGILKLTKLILNCDHSAKVIKEMYVPLIATQDKTLKILEISTCSFPDDSDGSSIVSLSPIIRVPFPSLQNLVILQIDYFYSFADYFEPINFAIKFPKLVEFRTCDIVTFLVKNLGHGGGLVKSVRLFKNTEWREKFSPKKCKLTFHEIFSNLEFLELDDIFDLSMLKSFDGADKNPTFWSRLEKVVLHCQLLGLFCLNGKLMKAAKKVEIVMNCGNNLMIEDYYKVFLGDFEIETLDLDVDFSDRYNRDKYYQQFMDSFSKTFASHSVSFTMVGYKISEDFKRDFRAIFPDCSFICSPFQVDWAKVQ